MNLGKIGWVCMPGENKRIDYIDFMNIYACFSVICMHCSGSVFEYGMTENRLFLLCLFVQMIAHPAIPVFFMITGTTLLEYRKKYDTKTFFRKRVIRTVFPFVFWTFFYLLRPVWMDGAPFPNIRQFITALSNNEGTGIFWFFYVLFAVYLCMPVFSLIADKKNMKLVEYICILSFLAVAVYPVLTRFLLPVYSDIIPPFVTGYTGYVFLGWLILRKEFSKKFRVCVYAAGILGAVLFFFGTWYLSAQAGYTDDFFMQYTSLACYPMSAAVMLFGKQIDWSRIYSRIPAEVVSKTASAGLGIYVIHLFFITVAEKNIWLKTHPTYFTLIMPFVVYGVSLGSVLLLRKIPGVRRIVP